MERKTRGRERGVALVWSAVCMLVLIGFAGLATDWGYSYWAAGQLQAAADAAALAGAQTLVLGVAGVDAEAILIAGKNTVSGSSVILTTNANNSAAGDIVLGTYNTVTNVFTPTIVSPNAVKVVASFASGSPNGPLPLFFGPAFKVNTVNITRTAIAITTGGGSSTAGMLLLSSNGNPALSLKGNGELNVEGGNVVVDSSAAGAVGLVGNGNITADNLVVVGGYSTKGNGAINGGIELGAAVTPDPLAGLPVPSVTNNQGTVSTKKGNVTLQPGYYPGGISISGGTVTLSPGIYNLGGAGISLTGQGSVTGDGVTLYLSGTAGISLTGQGSVTLTPPTSGTYQGVTVFQDRANTTADSLTGNGSIQIDGALYMPAAAVSMTGNGNTYGSMMVADTANLTGNGTININFAGGNKPPLPSSSYLVK